MKKTIKLLAIAAIASLTIVSCNNNATPADSTATENEATIEQTTEETQEEALVAETPDSIPAAEEQA